MKIIIDGYANPDEIIKNEMQDIKDEIQYHMHSEGKQPNRVIITPFWLWDYTEIYGDKKTDCVICSSNDKMYNKMQLGNKKSYIIKIA